MHFKSIAQLSLVSAFLSAGTHANAIPMYNVKEMPRFPETLRVVDGQVPLLGVALVIPGHNTSVVQRSGRTLTTLDDSEELSVITTYPEKFHTTTSLSTLSFSHKFSSTDKLKLVGDSGFASMFNKVDGDLEISTNSGASAYIKSTAINIMGVFVLKSEKVDSSKTKLKFVDSMQQNSHSPFTFTSEMNDVDAKEDSDFILDDDFKPGKIGSNLSLLKAVGTSVIGAHHFGALVHREIIFGFKTKNDRVKFESELHAGWGNDKTKSRIKSKLKSSLDKKNEYGEMSIQIKAHDQDFLKLLDQLRDTKHAGHLVKDFDKASVDLMGSAYEGVPRILECARAMTMALEKLKCAILPSDLPLEFRESLPALAVTSMEHSACIDDSTGLSGLPLAINLAWNSLTGNQNFYERKEKSKKTFN